MVKTRVRYTKAEDTLIKRCVSKDPENIKRALKKAASLLPTRTETSIYAHYYKELKEGPKIFELKGDKNGNKNTKNDERREKSEFTILSFIRHGISKLSDDDKRKLLKELINHF